MESSKNLISPGDIVYLLLSESKRIEGSMSNLYGRFSRTRVEGMSFFRIYGPDRDFWRTLSKEKRNHCNSFKEISPDLFGEGLPEEIFHAYLQRLRGLRGIIERIPKRGDFSRLDLLRIGYGLETETPEIHLETAMNGKLLSLPQGIKIDLLNFRKINGYNHMNHAERIRDYARSEGLAEEIRPYGFYLWQ